jgi:hypothetical protein
MAGFLGSGDLYFNRTVDGVAQGWVAIGNATKFEIKESSERKDRKSRGRNTYGQLLDAVYIKMPTEVNITLDEMNSENLALSFLGTVSTNTQASGTVASLALTAHVGKYVDVLKKNVSAVVVKSQDNATTYAAGTDYSVIPHMGMIYIIPGGSITEASTINVGFTYAGTTASRIIGAVQPRIEVALRLDGKNFVDDSLVMVDVYKALLTPNKPVDFLAMDFATLDMMGLAATPPGFTAPYHVDNRVVMS